MARSEDPTQTKTVRRTYGQRLRGAFARVNSAIREAIEEDDVFGLRDRDARARAGDGRLTADVTKPSDLSTLPPDQQIERFEDWLDTAMDGEVLEVIERDDNRFIRKAYERGLEDADQNLKQAGVSAGDDLLTIQLGGESAAAAAIRQPAHERTLQTLFSRNYAELDGITDEVARQVTRELADGLAEGVNPREMARRISDRVNKVGKTRATVLARTETINAYSESTLQRYEEFGVDGVTVQAEIRTAGDDRVCAECASLEGSVYTLEEARGLIPVHPQCRCAWLPVTNSS